MKRLTKELGGVASSGTAASPADFLTIDDWAKSLQLSKRTIFRMIDENIIPPYDLAVGKTRRWHRSTYDRWVSHRIGGD